ncbi:hypothetical protein PAHAL_7G332000 [Panicum hallii]|uniref:Uncharacterized protein n=1 Tax=Panicum hallii TaxID=206008 RepID=A0A2T8IEA0_9POAL|nr:hypothetical protein PAHAL_7G332000 [Panicum hallii]
MNFQSSLLHPECKSGPSSSKLLLFGLRFNSNCFALFSFILIYNLCFLTYCYNCDGCFLIAGG